MNAINKQLKYKGVFTALITPFKDEEIDKNALIGLIKWQLEQKINGLVIGGSTGEGSALTLDEKLELINIANNVIQQKVPLILGITSNTTQQAIFTIKKFSTLVDAFLVSPTYYNKPMPSGIYAFYKEIYKETEAPLIVYNIPSRCGVDILKETLVDILELPNILAIKESSIDLTKMLYIKQFNKKVIWLSGDDPTTLAFYATGGEGCISVVSNIIPAAWTEMYHAFKAGAIKRAQELNNEVYSLLQSLSLETNPITIKYALSLLKPFILPQLRSPLFEPADITKNSIKKAMSSLLTHEFA